MTPESVAVLLPELKRMGTQVVLISGGEPLIHPHWIGIAELLGSTGIKLWLLTSGLSLAKHAPQAARLFESITVSLDGTDRAMYAEIRGLDAFDKVCAGMSAVADQGVRPNVRVTVQRRNYPYLSGFVDLAHRCEARRVSFLAADVLSRQAFGRVGNEAAEIALRLDDLPLFSQTLDALERSHAQDFQSGFIAESPPKLRRLWQYYSAICGQEPFPPTRCNAPEFSAVIEASGRIDPCFFIQGPSHCVADGEFAHALNHASMRQLRADIRAGRRAECARCVCSMWRAPDELSGWAGLFGGERVPRHADALLSAVSDH